MNKLVARFLSAFGHPKTDDIDGFIAEYVTATKAVPPHVLEAAATNLITHQKFRAWPTVGEVMSAVRHAVSAPSTGKVLPPDIENFDFWWDDKVQRARSHSSDDELKRLFNEVRPYAESDMIMRWRWDELLRYARHNHETAAAIGIETPPHLLEHHRKLQKGEPRRYRHFGRPRWLDDDNEPKTDESRERVRDLVEKFKAQGVGLRKMPEPDPEDYRDPGEWASEVPYRPAFERMQAQSSNMMHRTPHGLTELSKRMTGEQE